MDDNINNMNDMHSSHPSFLAVILGSAKWLLWFLFTPLINWLIVVFPQWKDSLENFKLIGGAVIVVLVIAKLVLEIIKLTKK